MFCQLHAFTYLASSHLCLLFSQIRVSLFVCQTQNEAQVNWNPQKDPHIFACNHDIYMLCFYTCSTVSPIMKWIHSLKQIFSYFLELFFVCHLIWVHLTTAKAAIEQSKLSYSFILMLLSKTFIYGEMNLEYGHDTSKM